MLSGLLWHDKKLGETPAAAIQTAAARYRSKYGTAPNVAFVNPAQYQPGQTVDGIEIKPKQTIMLNNVWLGVDEKRRVGRPFEKWTRKYEVGETVRVNTQLYKVDVDVETGDMILLPVDSGPAQTLKIESAE